MESGLYAKLVFFAVRAKRVGAVICESLLRIDFPRAFFCILVCARRHRLKKIR